MIERAVNIRIAVAFAIASAFLLLTSAFFIYAASSVGKAQSKEILASQCVKEFEAYGIKSAIRAHDHAIVSYQPTTDLMQDRVKSSSIVIGRCAGYKLAEFCAGSGCAKPGVFFILEPV
ncbi:hypothetical protein LJR129_004933 [Acidovorax sp. LjRoot129]|uniref:hypothetical protein n=1 Tax=unclassified Acidovorax TaxID=2684926 RepID=UPI003ECC7A03